MDHRFNLVLVGCGKMGQNHARVVSESPHFKLVAVVDPALSPSVQLPPGVLTSPSLKELGARVDFDAAIIATPTDSHSDVVSELLSYKKKPFLLEKPISHSLENASKLLDLVKKAGVKAAVGHPERHNPVVRKLREIVQQGWLGKMIHFHFTRVGGYPTFSGQSNNVLLDLAVHDLDVLGSLVGPLKVLSGITHSTWKPGVYDTAEILLQSESGTSASIHVNWITPTKIRTIAITGTKGVCFVDYILQTCTFLGASLARSAEPNSFTFKDLLESYKNSDRVEFGVHKEEPLKVQLEEFYKLMIGEKNESCTLEEGLEAVRLADEAICSANTSRTSQ